MLSRLRSQKGAMFGLDARIALAIFGTLSVVSSGYMLVGLQTYDAQGLAQELRDTHTAIERIHNDIKQDLHNRVTVKNDINPIIAMYDPSVISPTTLVTKWNGPYLTRQATAHQKFGDIQLEKFQNDHVSACDSTNICYLWLTYSDVPRAVITELNEVFDGTSESNPDEEGRVQWTGAATPVKLFFRTTRALQIN